MSLTSVAFGVETLGIYPSAIPYHIYIRAIFAIVYGQVVHVIGQPSPMSGNQVYIRLPTNNSNDNGGRSTVVPVPLWPNLGT